MTLESVMLLVSGDMYWSSLSCDGGWQDKASFSVGFWKLDRRRLISPLDVLDEAGTVRIVYQPLWQRQQWRELLPGSSPHPGCMVCVQAAGPNGHGQEDQTRLHISDH